MKTIKLLGGTHDGETMGIHPIGGRYTPFIYLAKRISVSEAKALKISDSVAWKWPEEKYERDSEGNYVYCNTVEYRA